MNWLLGSIGLALGGGISYKIVTDYQHSGREILIGLAVFALLLVAIARLTRKPEPVPEQKAPRQPVQPPFYVMPAPPPVYGQTFDGGYGQSYTSEQEYLD